MYTPDRQLDPPMDDSDEGMIYCFHCPKEISIYCANRNDIDDEEVWLCNDCQRKYNEKTYQI